MLCDHDSLLDAAGTAGDLGTVLLQHGMTLS
jgi:hypothetical protein